MKQTLLIADDESQIREILEELFEDDFSLAFAASGDEVMDALAAKPSLIILDMHLPGRSGLEICQAITGMDPQHRPSVIAISGDTSDSLVKQAYELGVSDYIGKPFNLVTFHERVVRFANDVRNIRALQQKDKEIGTLAQTAMKQAASYGRALELVAKMNDCHSPQDIMQAVGQNFLGQDLKIAIQLRSDTETFSYDVDSITCSDIELQVFDVLREHGRIYHFGRRTIFNDRHVSILFKNMPLEGTLSFDAILDVAAKLILAVEARFMSLLEHQSLLATRDKLRSALDMLSSGINSMESERRELIDQIAVKIGLSFHELDMTEEQEQFFINLIEKEIRSKEKSSNLGELQRLISDCVDEMILSESHTNEEKAQPDVTDSDIELF
ncbi:response regulator transcription factor [Alteromonas sp. CYL-A6]|uniref:response regulator transcription factor n=1 Tax=Alteromonas nitratireducens TaxID=3390813 RepID=UPI0034B040D7